MIFNINIEMQYLEYLPRGVPGAVGAAKTVKNKNQLQFQFQILSADTNFCNSQWKSRICNSNL